MLELFYVQPPNFIINQCEIVLNLLAVEGLDGRVKSYFGRCLSFFRDAIGDHYIAVRWFQASQGDRKVVDPLIQIPRLQETSNYYITSSNNYRQ